MTRAVCIDSDDEVVTGICTAYRDQHIYPLLAPQLGMTRLTGAGATRAALSRELSAGGVALITGSGHGFSNRFTGQHREAVLQIGQYAPIEVAGSIVHLLACETGQALGANLVANGCHAFFGYDETFVFPVEVAPLFLEADSQIDLTLAAGRTAQEAYDAAVRMFNRHIRRLLVLGKPFLAAVLARNRDHLCAPTKDPKWGNPHASLPPAGAS